MYRSPGARMWKAIYQRMAAEPPDQYERVSKVRVIKKPSVTSLIILCFLQCQLATHVHRPGMDTSVDTHAWHFLSARVF